MALDSWCRSLRKCAKCWKSVRKSFYVQHSRCRKGQIILKIIEIKNCDFFNFQLYSSIFGSWYFHSFVKWDVREILTQIHPLNPNSLARSRNSMLKIVDQKNLFIWTIYELRKIKQNHYLTVSNQQILRHNMKGHLKACWNCSCVIKLNGYKFYNSARVRNSFGFMDHIRGKLGTPGPVHLHVNWT